LFACSPVVCGAWLFINKDPLYLLPYFLAWLGLGVTLKYWIRKFEPNPERALRAIEKIFFVAIFLITIGIVYEIGSNIDTLKTTVCFLYILFWVVGCAGMVLFVRGAIAKARSLVQSV
jgi:Kef-type K+ transport system membrane component KefB